MCQRVGHMLHAFLALFVCVTVCEYYVHIECQDFALSNCKQCATYTRNAPTAQSHHWREGNIATGGGGVKCAACRRAILTECLTGYCCEWCGAAVHTGCLHKIAKQECDFGVLREIILPPSCIFVPQTDISTETVLCIQRRQTSKCRLNCPFQLALAFFFK